MLEVTPEMVLGKNVLDARGRSLGDVVDVGVHDVRRVKFLLVKPGDKAQRSFVRLNVDSIDAISPSDVRLKIA